MEECVDKLASLRDPGELLRAYVVIQTAAELTEPVTSQDIDHVLQELSSLEPCVKAPDFEAILETRKDMADIAWLERQKAILERKLAWRTNEYSYGGMIYQMEKVTRGPTSIQQRQKFQNMSLEISEAERKLQAHLEEKESLAAVEEAIDRMTRDIEEEESVYGPKSKEELDREYQDLIAQIKEVAKRSNH